MATNGDVILEMRHIVKRFGPVTALNDVNIMVKRGQIFSICGENGAGKSTLMNVLSGVYPYGTYEGDIVYNGETCKFRTIRDSEEKGIVIIHQELALVPYMSIQENIFLGNQKKKGIDTKKVDFEIFLNMGFLVSIASIITLSRLASASAQTGMEFEMDAIAACFIGGTAVTGGIGTIPGAMVGALIMGVLNQGLSIMGVDAAWVKTIKGLVVIAAVAYDLLSKKKKG